MAKVVCVLYDDPVDGYPKSYPRDGLPHLDGYPTANRCRHHRRPTSPRARCWAASRVNSVFGPIWRGSATSLW
jgi:hypothetical protein